MNTEERIATLNDALSKVLAQKALTASDLADLSEQEVFIRGQITEREFDAEQVVELPVFEIDEDMISALDHRGKGFFGEAEKAVAAQRQEVFEREAQKKADFINESA